MQVNPTTAHPCANTSLNSKTDSLIQKINEAPEWAISMIDSVIEAFAFHETSGIEAIIANPETSPEERELLSEIITKVKKELEKASFQPVFTKEQVKHFEENQQHHRDVRRRIALFSLCITEKRMQSIAKNNPDTFLDIAENCDAFIDDSKAQLELAEAALARLLLVGDEFIGVSA